MSKCRIYPPVLLRQAQHEREFGSWTVEKGDRLLFQLCMLWPNIPSKKLPVPLCMPIAGPGVCQDKLFAHDTRPALEFAKTNSYAPGEIVFPYFFERKLFPSG
jgi:hypothetical protein